MSNDGRVEAREAQAALDHAFAEHDDWLGHDDLIAEGWDAFLVEDLRLAVEALFTAQGARSAASPALDFVVASALGEPAVDAVRAGARVALPGPLQAADVVDGHMTGYATGVPDRVLNIRAETLRVFTTESGLRTAPLHSLDDTVTFYEVADWGAVETSLELTSGQAERAAALAHLALAYEAAATVDAMLTLTLETAGARTVYGRPLTQYQVVKHQLASVYEAQSAARAALDESWSDLTFVGSLLAREAVGRAVMRATSICPQVCGGMSTTLEFPMHRHVRRALVLVALCGSSRTRAATIGSYISKAAEVPRFRVPHEMKLEVSV